MFREVQDPSRESWQPMTRSAVSSPAAPKALGPYSHGLEASGHFVFLSGQTPVDPATGQLVDGDITAQAKRVFANLATVLDTVGLGFGDVVKVNVYLTDMADFTDMNEVYAETFPEPYPARTTVAVAQLPLDARIEIELTAVR